MKHFYSLELPPIIDKATLEQLNPDDQNKIQKFLPNASTSSKMEDFFNSLITQSSTLSTNKKEFTALRKYVQGMFDNKVYGFNVNGYDFNNKLTESPLKRTFTEFIDSILPNNQKNNLYLKTWYAYMFLEQMNICPDRNKSGLKESTFTNMSADAHHVFFATYCDVLVSADQGLIVKAKIIYYLLNQNIQALDVINFIELYGPEDTQLTAKTLIEDLINQVATQDPIYYKNIETNLQFAAFVFNKVLLSYFNKCEELDAGTYKLILYKETGSVSDSILLYNEIELLINKLNSIFGKDLESKGPFTTHEVDQYLEHLRVWKYNGLQFKLLYNNSQNLQCLCLMLEYIEVSQFDTN